MFLRYQRCSAAVESFMLVEASALASNKLLAAVEASFSGHVLTTADYLFLGVISEKRGKNYAGLTDVKATQMIFAKLRDAALQATHIEEG
jgi:hypothetical protein